MKSDQDICVGGNCKHDVPIGMRCLECEQDALRKDGDKTCPMNSKSSQGSNAAEVTKAAYQCAEDITDLVFQHPQTAINRGYFKNAIAIRIKDAISTNDDSALLEWLEKWMAKKHGNEIYGPVMPLRLNRDCSDWTLKEGFGNLMRPISTGETLRQAIRNAMKETK